MKSKIILFLLLTFSSASLSFVTIYDTSIAKNYNERVKFAENNPLSDTLCKVLYTVTNTIAKAILIFVIVVTALGFFLGKVSWGIVIAIIVGAGFMFSAENLLVIFVGAKAVGGCECKKGIDGDNCSKRNNNTIPEISTTGQ